MKHTKTFIFMDIPCEIFIEEYEGNGQAAISLITTETEWTVAGEPMATASVCIPDMNFQEGQTALKTWSENEGLYEALVQAGVVKATGRMAYAGNMPCPIVQIQ